MSPRLHTLYHIMRADFRERVRRYSFLIVLGITVYAGYLLMPAADASYATLVRGSYRGLYNAALDWQSVRQRGRARAPVVRLLSGQERHYTRLSDRGWADHCDDADQQTDVHARQVVEQLGCPGLDPEHPDGHSAGHAACPRRRPEHPAVGVDRADLADGLAGAGHLVGICGCLREHPSIARRVWECGGVLSVGRNHEFMGAELRHACHSIQ